MATRYKKKTNTIVLSTTEIARLRQVLKNSEYHPAQPKQMFKNQQQVAFGLNYNCAKLG